MGWFDWAEEEQGQLKAAANAAKGKMEGQVPKLGKLLSEVSESVVAAVNPEHTVQVLNRDLGRHRLGEIPNPIGRSAVVLGKLGHMINPASYARFSLRTVQKVLHVGRVFASKNPIAFFALLGTALALFFSKKLRGYLSSLLSKPFNLLSKISSILGNGVGNFASNIKGAIARLIPRAFKRQFRIVQSAIVWAAKKLASTIGGAAGVAFSKLSSVWPISILTGEGSSKLAGFFSGGIGADLKALGNKIPGNIATLVEVAFSKGKPVDDKQLATEKLVSLAATLPATSKVRQKITAAMIETLWDSLPHPPVSFMGQKYKYRQADGSHNNALFPELGKAGTAYAKSVRSATALHGIRPDPGVLFDLLLARPDGDAGFTENPTGLSAVVFYHASIIIHDIFRTNRLDSNVSDTSSYLDLAPLYGSSVADQEKIRTFQKGMLKPDTFHEKRLLGQPAGVNVMLVFYSRFHNYCANMLLTINENDRFTLRGNTEEDLKRQDEDLFQTARLIVGGLYMNISLHDYLRALNNINNADHLSDWTIDPRLEINKDTGPLGRTVERGCGNQVSAEFNLLYRFHSVISQKDEKWLNDFLTSLFPEGLDKPLSELTPQELMTGLLRFEHSIDPDPSKRTFDGLQRGQDGKFKDEDLVRIFKESIEDHAGRFGPRTIPKALKVIEVLGIMQARKWGMASLNEFRKFFNLKTYDTFEEMTSDMEIQYLLKSLYDSPDMVELYPGLMIEDVKPRIDPGSTGSLPYTLSRAVVSDAITLVRSDRFYTHDYTVQSLTAWGMAEVQQDYKVLGGSMLYKLVQRAVPGWFPYNSLHVMMPFFTKDANRSIAKRNGTYDQYTEDDPKPPGRKLLITDPNAIREITEDKRKFIVTTTKPFANLWPGSKRDYANWPGAGDTPANTNTRNILGEAFFGTQGAKKLYFEFLVNTARDCLHEDMFGLGKNVYQFDVVRDVSIPCTTRFFADLCSLDLITEENPKGSMTEQQLYNNLLEFREWYLQQPEDAATLWGRRFKAQDAAKTLQESTRKMVANVASKTGSGPKGVLTKVTSWFKPSTYISGYEPREGGLRWFGEHVAEDLLMAGLSVDEAAEQLFVTASGSVGISQTALARTLNYFLNEADLSIWTEIQKLAAEDSDSADEQLRKYAVEGHRLANNQFMVRMAKEDTTIGTTEVKAGDTLALWLARASRDPSVNANAMQFDIDRPKEQELQFGHGPHECLGREIVYIYMTALLKVLGGLKNLRPAPGKMGLLKTIQRGPSTLYMTPDWARIVNYPTTWKLHCDGYGVGTWSRPPPSNNGGLDSGSIAAGIIAQHPELAPSAEDTANTGAAGDAKPKTEGAPSQPQQQPNVDLKQVLRCNALEITDERWKAVADAERADQSSKNEKYWQPGKTLKIKFLGGSDLQQERFVQAASHVAQVANIHFEKVADGAAEVRVSFDAEKPLYSWVGTDCAAIAQIAGEDTPSTNVGYVATALGDENDAAQQWSPQVTHLVGHIIGLAGEVPKPLDEFNWNQAYVDAYKSKLDEALGGLSSRVNYQVDLQANLKPFGGSEQGSFMQEHTPKEFLTDAGEEIATGRDDFTEADKDLLDHVYPHSSTENAGEQAAPPAEPEAEPEPPKVLLRNPVAIVGNLQGAQDNYDDSVYFIDLPFPISLYGKESKRIGVSTNGVLELLPEGSSDMSNAYNTEDLPTSRFKTAILAFWEDLYIYKDTEQGIFYETTTGDAGKESVTFEYYLSRFRAQHEYYHFQIKFSQETPGIVTCKYYTISDSGANATIGVQNEDRSKSLQFSRSTPSVPHGTTVIFDTNENTFKTETFDASSG